MTGNRDARRSHAAAAIAVAACAAVAAGPAGCGKGESFDALFVEIAAEAGLQPDHVSLVVLKDDGDGRAVTPRDPDQASLYTFDVTGRDLQAMPYVAKLVPGAEFKGPATVVAFGLAGGRPTGRGIADVDLSAQTRVRVVLSAIPEDCDLDGDGFLDGSRVECCAQGDRLCDCNDQQAKATPVGFEDECTRCGYGDELFGDSVDDDCDGTAARCRDADGDRSKDCLPSWCQAESQGQPQCEKAKTGIDCDPSDGTIYPGSPEVCDGKDNDCNGLTDDGGPVTIVEEGVTKGLGEPCGLGACTGGVVECDPATGVARCSTDVKKAAQEVCGNVDAQGELVDDNCNGFTDDPVKDACEKNDLDGDGVEDDIEDEYCGPLAKYHPEIFPEFGPSHPDVPADVKHANPEPCCLEATRSPGTVPELCDLDCDGSVKACLADDQDGDGYPAGSDTDCDDHDPKVHAGAPEKCGDGIDQDCKGGDLKCSLVADKDGDGFGSDVDCDDGDDKVNPWAAEACNGRDDDCDGLTDEGNPGPNAPDEPCGTDVGECHKGLWVCVHAEDAGAKDECRESQEPVDERCDKLDNDCNGQTDETFEYDGHGVWQDPADTSKGALECVGIGECGKFGGLTECRKSGDGATCSTNPDGSDRQDKAEACNDLDDDCDGQTDDGVTSVEDSTCRKVGACGAGMDKIQATCTNGVWECDYQAVPGFEADVEKTCDEIDNDCDGQTDEDFVYSDAVNPTPVKKGAGCGTGECANGTVVCAKDGTGLACDTSLLLKSEQCDGLDNDCNGVLDEGFSYQGIGVWKNPTVKDGVHNACTGVGECAKKPGIVECQGLGAAGCSTNEGGSESLAQAEVCDDKDNDCNGKVDDGLDTVEQSTCRVQGVCETWKAAIQALCTGGQWSCDYSGVLSYEAEVEKTCDGKDNDCDGAVDEDFVLTDFDGTTRYKDQPCGTGACAGGHVQCTADGKWVECSTASLSTTEVCDGKDNDCDGVIDDGQTYMGVPVGKQCQGIGECGKYPGLVECHATLKVAACSTNPNGSGHKDSIEVCDGKDNDCDGTTDEGLGLYSADCKCKKVGACQTGVIATCTGGSWSCDYDGVPGGEFPAELHCDGVDNDCDGSTDEEFTLKDWDGTTKKKGETCGTGACALGVVQCRADHLGVECSTASKAKAETCNNIDDDCNGVVDDGNLCDDQAWCTADTCQAGKCVHDVAEAYCLIDGTCRASGDQNVLNQCEHCVPGKSDSAWSYDGDGTACNLDSNGCTQGDQCNGGACKAGAAASCAHLDTACTKGACVSDGANAYHCAKQNVNEGGSCDDLKPCTCNDRCQAGQCVADSHPCSDGLSCTDDVCDGACGCSYPIHSTWCVIDDGAGPACVAATTERPGWPCQACIPATSQKAWSPRPENDACQDGNACTTGEKCHGGICSGGAPVVCTEYQCQTVHCDTSLGCQYQAVPADPPFVACNDGNPCTKNDHCNGLGSCVSTESYSCPSDGLLCTTDTCNGDGTCSYPVKTGFCAIDGQCWSYGDTKPGNVCQACLATNQKAWSNYASPTCSDSNVCTTGDHCEAGACIGSGTVNCDDNDVCTTDGCDSVTQCTHVPAPNGTTCNDNNLCTTGDQCLSGKCQGTPVSCSQPNPTCFGGACGCGADLTCVPSVTDLCENNSCHCGTGGPVCSQPNPYCLSSTCKCNATTQCGKESDRCVGDATTGVCRCGTYPFACSGVLNPNCYGESCKCSATEACQSATSDHCFNGVSCVCAGDGVSCIGNVLHPNCVVGVGCRCGTQQCNTDKANLCMNGFAGIWCSCGGAAPCGSDKHCCSDGTCKTSC